MTPSPLDEHGRMTGRVLVVTGAARGMGAAIVRAALKSQANVVAIDRSWSDIDPYWQSAEDSRAELKAQADHALMLEADVCDPEAIANACETALARFGSIDALVNGAVLLQHHLFPPTGRTTILDTSNEHWQQMFGANTFGPLNVIRAFAPHMMQKESGSIINLSTRGSITNYIRPDSREQPYMASRAALVSLSLYLAEELRGSNIAVNVAFAGHSQMSGAAAVDDARRELGMSVSRRVRPDHIAPLALHLASCDARSGPTGQMLWALRWNLLHGLGDTDEWY